MSIFERIKNFFGRKRLPEGTKNEIILKENNKKNKKDNNKTQICTAEELFYRNVELGKREKELDAQIKEGLKERRAMLERFVEKEFEESDELKKMCITADLSTVSSSVIESYLVNKLMSNNMKFESLTLNQEEISALIGYIRSIEFSGEYQNVETGIVEGLGLTAEQEKAFGMLDRTAREELLKDENSVNVKNILNAINMVVGRIPVEPEKREKYFENLSSLQKFISTDEGNQYINKYLNNVKLSMKHSAELGAKEGCRLRLLETIDKYAKLPGALKDTYKDTEDYMEKSKRDIHNPLMRLLGISGHRQELVDYINKILAEGKTIAIEDKTKGENQVSYQEIEKAIGIKFNPKAIMLLESFAYAYQRSQIDEKHSIFIGTHRKSARTLLMETSESKDKTLEELVKEGKLETIGEAYARRILSDENKETNIYSCIEDSYKKVKSLDELLEDELPTKYDRFVNGKMYHDEFVSQEVMDRYTALRKEEGVIESPITSHEQLTSLMYRLDQRRDEISERMKYYINEKIKGGLKSQSLNEEERKYVDKFLGDKDIGRSKLFSMYGLVPNSLISDRDVKDEMDDKELEEVLVKSSSKVDGLKECIDKIFTSIDDGSSLDMPTYELFSKRKTKSSTIGEEYEKILIQAVEDGQITCHEYLDCMESMQCAKEVCKNIKLTPRETVRYICAKEGGSKTDSPEKNVNDKEHDM